MCLVKLRFESSTIASIQAREMFEAVSVFPQSHDAVNVVLFVYPFQTVAAGYCGVFP